MKILCGITPWQERKVERGRSVGSVIKDRVVIAADKWNWIIGIEGADGVIRSRKYFGSIRHTLDCISRYTKTNLQDVAVTIAAKLYELTGIVPNVEFNEKPDEIGRNIDLLYSTSFHKATDIYRRLFKEEDQDEQEEMASKS